MRVAGCEPIGSEGIISNLCRDIARTNSDILEHPSIQEMKDSKCRHILCIDDIIGSGNRMVSFAKWLFNNKTIKSWHSSHYIDFVACAYAGSDYGKKNASQIHLFSEVLLVQSVSFGRTIWTGNQRDQIDKLCRRYSIYTSKPRMPLGFKDSFTCIVFAHKCPNTNPAILWASKKNSWNAIFSNRPEFIMNNEIKDKTEERQEKILKVLGHTRLLNSILFRQLNSESRQIMIILSCLAAHRHYENVLSDILELPIPIIRQQLERCRMYGCIDKGNRITVFGKKVLGAARKNKYIPENKFDIKNDFYYPLTYREPASSSSLGLNRRLP